MIYCAIIAFFLCFVFIFYIFSHTWATTAFRQKVPIGLIANAMGHSSVKVTETYLKPFEEEELNRVNEGIIKYTMGQMNAAV